MIKVCSDVWPSTKMWKLCYFEAKQYYKTVNFVLNGLSCYFSLTENLDFFLKSLITSTTGQYWLSVVSIFAHQFLLKNTSNKRSRITLSHTTPSRTKTRHQKSHTNEIFLNGPTSASFKFIFVVSNTHYNFYNK